MNNDLQIIFFGSGSYVIPVLDVLSKNFNVPLVLTTENLASQGEALQGSPVIKFCKENGMECISVSKFDETIRYKLNAIRSPIGVLANFGLILPQTLLDIFPKGIINVHPSLLPKYRGPTPGQTAILNGDKNTGVSIIKLDADVDHGSILAQTEEPILDEDTAETLYIRLFNIGAQLLIKSLPKYLNGDLIPTPQDHLKATFTKTLTRDSGFIDLSAISNQQSAIRRMIRAYSPWPGVWTKFGIKNNELRIKFLPENKIQVEGKKPMSYKDFLNGYPGASAEISEILSLSKDSTVIPKGKRSCKD